MNIKELFVFSVMLWLSFSCSNSIDQIFISNSENHYVQSDTLIDTFVPIRKINNPWSEKLILTDGLTQYRFNSEIKKFETVEYLEYSPDEIIQVSDYSFLNFKSRPYSLLTLVDGKINISEIPYFFGNFTPQYSSSNFMAIGSDNKIVLSLIYYPEDAVTSIDSHFWCIRKNRVGVFNIVNDSFVLESSLDINETIYKKSHKEVSLSYDRFLIRKNNHFYVAVNSIDTIFIFDEKITLEKKIGLPRSFGFKYYERDQGKVIIEKHDAVKSKMDGHKILSLYGAENDYLAIIITECLEYGVDGIEPSLGELDWYVVLYNTKTEQWHRAIKFNKNHNKHFVYFADDCFYVAKCSEPSFIFDSYDY